MHPVHAPPTIGCIQVLDMDTDPVSTLITPCEYPHGAH